MNPDTEFLIKKDAIELWRTRGPVFDLKTTDLEIKECEAASGGGIYFVACRLNGRTTLDEFGENGTWSVAAVKEYEGTMITLRNAAVSMAEAWIKGRMNPRVSKEAIKAIGAADDAAMSALKILADTMGQATRNG